MHQTCFVSDTLQGDSSQLTFQVGTLVSVPWSAHKWPLCWADSRPLASMGLAPGHSSPCVPGPACLSHSPLYFKSPPGDLQLLRQCKCCDNSGYTVLFSHQLSGLFFNVLDPCLVEFVAVTSSGTEGRRAGQPQPGPGAALGPRHRLGGAATHDVPVRVGPRSPFTASLRLRGLWL